ncbi:MAG: hypothetical protein U0792_16155 [Gemmataceae bacterium]
MVAALDDPKSADAPWLFVLEFQAQHDRDKLEVTLEEVAILRSRVRHGADRQGRYKVAAGLIYLRDRSREDNLDMRFPDGSGTCHVPRIWNVGIDDGATDVEGVAAGSLSWGLLFWIPLMVGGGDDDTITEWKEAVSSRVADRVTRGNLAGIALIFAELAGHGIAWKRALEGFDMTESQVVNEWLTQGETQGKLRERREVLVRVLNKRFPGVVPPEVTKLINEQESFDLLRHWFDAALDATAFADFMAVLKQ